jgi:hypothetical protein
MAHVMLCIYADVDLLILKDRKFDVYALVMRVSLRSSDLTKERGTSFRYYNVIAIP